MKILFVHQGLQSFVRKDLDILQEAHEVRSIEFKGNVAGFVGNLCYLWQGVGWCDLTFSWFGKPHAFFAVLFSKMLRKKAVVVAGGDDVARMPEIKYGMFCFWWKRWCPKLVFNHADIVLTVSDNNTSETVVNAKVNPKNIKRVYHGFDTVKFMNRALKKEDMVITIGNVSWEYLKRKGVELFTRAASCLPDIPFYIIGEWKDDSIKYLNNIATSNVHFLGRLPIEKLMTFMSRTKVYVQISLHEGFGCSLAEAMLCECIPVVSRNAAIPEVVGDVGIYVEELTPEQLAKKIKYALSLPDEYGKKARNRIIEYFPLEKRRREILMIIEGINNV